MKNKSWPIGIFVVYVLFMAGILYIVNIAVTTKFNTTDEYYYQENLTNQQKIEHKQQTKNDNAYLTFTNDNSTVFTVKFPSFIKDQNSFKGQLTFFRPSDERLDKTIPLVINESHESTHSINDLEKGFWRVQVSWQISGKSYYDEYAFTKEGT